jgi:hypothetical protein
MKLCVHYIYHVNENVNFLGCTVLNFVSKYVQLAEMKWGQS